jgi:hypothetical protein
MSGYTSSDLPNWLAQQKAKNAAEGIGDNLLAPAPAANRPVGAERLDDTYAGPPSPSFSPVIGNYGAHPVTAAMRANALDIASVASQFGPADMAAIRAFHGSPYDFHAFDTSKIGTGEGAQAYGHGLYFAENEPIAAYYRDTLSNRAPDQFTVGGVTMTSDDLAKRLVSNFGMSTSYAAKTILRDLAAGRGWDEIRASNPDRPHFTDGIDWLQSQNASAIPRGEGKMYEVSLNADPEHFLDWDKPLSEQHDKVVSAIADLAAKKGIPMGNATGARAYEDLSNPPYGTRGHGVNDPAALSEALRDAGIPGIRYLDQGSRNVPAALAGARADLAAAQKALAADPGNVRLQKQIEDHRWDIERLTKNAEQGTSNYVVFDPKTIEILRKYGIAGLMAGSAAAATQPSNSDQ